jgi:hypothetical protein
VRFFSAIDFAVTAQKADPSLRVGMADPAYQEDPDIVFRL